MRDMRMLQRIDRAGHRAVAMRPGSSGSGMVLCLGLAGGCGASDPWNRQAISGVVTLDGQPLDEGAILLEPLADGRLGHGRRRDDPARVVRDRARPGADPGLVPGADLLQLRRAGPARQAARPSAPGGRWSNASPRSTIRSPSCAWTSSAGGSNRFRFDLHADGGS